jgi:hypothetical protein
MSFLDRIDSCNTYDLSHFVPFQIDQQTLGWIKPSFAETLKKSPSIFDVQEHAITFSAELDSADTRSAAIAEVAADWAEAGLVQKLMHEIYPVRKFWPAPDQFRLDRVLVPLFGIRAYGVHLNGYLKHNDKIMLWIGKRSDDREIEPGKLDNIVAGGQPAGLSIMGNLMKESAEEASIPEYLTRSASSVGTIRYCKETEAGLKPDTLFCYDLELPPGFVPVNQDGEIEDFRLMPIDAALELISQGDAFKFNVSLVILDFAIRHGILTPDNEPSYEAILAGLHAPPPHVHAT